MLVLAQQLINIRTDDLRFFSLFFNGYIRAAASASIGPRSKKLEEKVRSVCHIFSFYFPRVFLAEFYLQVISQSGQKATCSWKGEWKPVKSKQPKRSSIDKCNKEMWHVHIMEYYSAREKNYILESAITGMELQIIISETSQRKTNTIWFYLYVESKKMNIGNL